MALIELNDISKLYGFGNATTVALDEVSLKVEPGEFIAVMGPSGCGKSSLMNIIGLLDRPSHGDYTLSGKKVSRLKSNQRAKVRRDQVGFVLQSFNLLPRLSALDNVALPLTYKGMSQTKRLKLAANALERVGLSDREYFLPHQLSGGQAQRVAIARALVNNPSVLIADEPTGNLDSASSRLVMELLADIHKTGATILMVTHNPELTRYASRVIFMHDARIISDVKSAIGRVPEQAKKTMYKIPSTTLEDDAAGVAALMTIDKEKQRSKKNKKSSAKSKRQKSYKLKAKVKV